MENKQIKDEIEFPRRLLGGITESIFQIFVEFGKFLYFTILLFFAGSSFVLLYKLFPASWAGYTKLWLPVITSFLKIWIVLGSFVIIFGIFYIVYTLLRKPVYDEAIRRREARKKFFEERKQELAQEIIKQMKKKK